jgi:DNA-binding transcriptional regulator YdaS (Cro superfamily)
MTSETHLTETALFDQLNSVFGLNQTALGRLLGLTATLMSHVKAGRRSLPATAYVPLARLTVAMQAVPPDLAAPAPDPANLARQARVCRATAARLVLEQAALAERAAWANRRLAAVPVLRANLTDLAPEAEPPRWLARFEAEAREALLMCGPLVQTRLALRRAALLHEVALLDRLLGGEALAEVVPPGAGTLDEPMLPLPAG